ncbi:MAG TPA: hypothetical protein VF331_21290 [Polyangiales bacterium]
MLFGDGATDEGELLNLASALHKSFGLDVPERDYARIATLRGCVDYIAAKLG